MRAYRLSAHRAKSSHPARAGGAAARPIEPLEGRLLMAAGFLDTSFDGDGRLVRPDAATGMAVVVQPDGRVVTAGSVDGPGGNDFFLARYNPDGSPDATFGDGGVVHTDFAGRSDAARGIALQSDGKIVAVGSSGRLFAVARYNTDGGLDLDFAPGYDDGSGRLTFGFGGVGAAALDVAIQPDRRIVISGSASLTASDSAFALARVTPEGILDPTFGTAGIVTTAHGLTAAWGVAIGPGGKIVAGGTADSGQGDSALVRYNPDGSLDTTFNPFPEGDDAAPAGIVRGAFDAVADYDEISDVAVQPDGGILAAGHIATRGFTVVRFSEDGVFAHKFDAPPLYSGGGAFAKALTVQPDGKIVAAGYTTDDQENPENFVVVRYNPDVQGTVDSSFSLNGVAVTDFRSGPGVGGADPRDGAYAVAVSPTDRSIVAAGSSQGRSAIARYHGAADTGPAPVTLTAGVGLALTGSDRADDVCLYPADAAGQSFVADLSGSLFLVPSAQASKVWVDVGGGNDVVRALAGPAGNPFNVATDVNGGDGNDTLTGGGAGDVLRGGAGNDTLDGGRGSDALLGGAGDDVLLASETAPGGGAAPFSDDYYAGEAGNDTIDYSGRSTPLWVRLGTSAGGSSRERDIIRGDVENVVGGSGNDRIEGNDRANVLRGGGGNDTLFGRGGNDTLSGDAGDDVLVDTSGRNTLDGGAGFDTVNGVREQPPVDVILQAEDAALTGVSVGRSNGGYTGTGYADYNHATGDVVEWTFNSPAAGTRTLTFRYALGSGSRPLELRVNGAVINPSLNFAATGSFSTWQTVTVTVPLTEGQNKIRLTSIGSNGPNIDSLRIS